MENRKQQDSDIIISDYQYEALARCLLPKIQAYYESDEGKQMFEAWKAKQEIKP